ncbi:MULTISPECIES: hypothetical protein [Streptomyces]|uniref:hypothetical protein n=1 Tax=Streptomyces TaxID=1883 RepID=UPI00163C9AD7|nr:MULTISPECIES: hypothetical protein [Streptomyces]MBC2879808.1 hypothetical protein [Streptomyces sp. TYQ1024]UBI41414.1 hypothetical protein K7I03_33660 [Streptomyces mobaraensis]
MDNDDSTDHGRTLALRALAEWPGRRDRLPTERADLVVTAWRAGARTVAELARVADVSRDVIYSDLRTAGIDPSDPQARKQPITPTPQQAEAGHRPPAGMTQDQAAEIIEAAAEAYIDDLDDPAHIDTNDLAWSIVNALRRAGLGLDQ